MMRCDDGLAGDILIRTGPGYLCAYCCCSVSTLIFVILIAVSFEYVHYNEFGFKKNSLTNKVDISQVFTNGRHFVGPTVSFVRFPTQYQTETFAGSSVLSVFNEEGMAIEIEADFQYRIKEDKILDLMETYGTNYEAKLRSICEASLKNTAIEFTIYQYLREREIIAETFNSEVTVAMRDIFLDVEDFKLELGEITLPAAQMTKFMDDAVVKQNAQKSFFEQQARVVRDETDRDAAEVGAKATFVQREAAANSLRIVQEDQAEADRILAEAYAIGWMDALNELGIAEEDQAEFLRLMGILDNASSPQLVDSDLQVMISNSG